MADKVTPEEKLLKVIENPINAREGGILDTKESLKGVLFIKKWWAGLEKIKIQALFSLKNVYKLLIISSVLVSSLAIFTFMKGYNDFKKRIKNIETSPYAKLKEEKAKYLFSVDLKEAIKDISRRNIFSSLAEKPEAVPSREIELTIANLKLVGIIWSANPQAMIEDIKENKTFLLGAGEAVGNFKIKKILRDRVIIGKDEQEWELR